MVNQEDCNVPLVRKFFQKPNVLIVIRVQIAVTARTADTLQRINDNEFCVRMLCRELLDLLFQPVLERVSDDRKVQRRWRVLGQIKEPRLDTLERIFETEIQRFALRCCEIPERLPLRNAQAKPQGQPRLADLRCARENMQALWDEFVDEKRRWIRLIQERYAWFLDGVFADAVFEKKKGQKKIPLAPMICSRGYEAFISGVSLGENPEADAPPVKTQYRIRGEKENAEIVEKMYFDRLLDFVYVEFMKGLQKGFVPKRCANCGRWFLQAPGATFAYCAGPAPEDPGKTCREIGAASSFKDKVANNEVWQVQQRAYKKYYARTMRKDMTKAEFEAWTRDAEQKRDAALEPYARAESEEERQRIAAELEEKLNRL